MANIRRKNNPLFLAALELAPSSMRILVVAVLVLIAAVSVSNVAFGLSLLAIGMSLLSVAAISRISADFHRRDIATFKTYLAEVVNNDAVSAIATGEDLEITFRNHAASARFGDAEESIGATLEKIIASPTAMVRRMSRIALDKGFAREDVVGRLGHFRVSAHRTGHDFILWRVEDVPESTRRSRSTDTISIPMLTASRSGTILYTNNALRQILGERQSHLDCIINDLPIREDDIHEIAGAEGPLAMRVHTAQGAVGRQEIFMVPAEAKPELQINNWAGLDGLPVALLKVAPDGKVLECNAPARELLDIDDMEGLYFGELVEGLGRSVVDWLKMVSQHRLSVQSEFVKATRPNNETFIQILPGVVQDGDDDGLVIVMHDATKLKTLEAQFIQSQKMQAIGQLAGGVAHDFNNLLTAISGHCDLLMLRHDEGDPDFGDLVQIHQNANRAASLVGQLLAFSRKQTLKPEIIESQDVLEDLTHLLNRLVGERVSLVQNHASDLPSIRADKRQLEQVLMNLVVNARDAMPDGGTIHLETRTEILARAYERDRAVVPPGEYVVIEVRDQGHGIPNTELPKIFEPFYTTKRTGEGTGLGLSMAYGIIKQTGGFIFADSVVGTGTTFTLFFPVTDEPKVNQKALAPVNGTKQTATKDGGVILLVEDEAPVRAFASRALAMRGFSVVEADCAEEALRMLDDPDLKIDVFVTDVIMPGMDGPSWVAKALKQRPDTKVVFVSGYAEDYFSDQQSRIPNSVFLPKPFSLSQLTATVSQQMH